MNAIISACWHSKEYDIRAPPRLTEKKPPIKGGFFVFHGIIMGRDFYPWLST